MKEFGKSILYGILICAFITICMGVCFNRYNVISNDLNNYKGNGYHTLIYEIEYPYPLHSKIYKRDSIYYYELKNDSLSNYINIVTDNKIHQSFINKIIFGVNDVAWYTISKTPLPIKIINYE